MQKVVIINLNGRAYQLDEGAYEGLRAYLDRAESQLAANPDKTEIIADLEQAIAEKCDRFLGPSKNVVTAAEIEQVIQEMGPVHDSTSDTNGEPRENASQAKEPPRADPSAPRRLYRIREGAMIDGVCNGLAAYFSIDVTLVRVIAVILAVLTSGALILAYVVLMFVLPPVSTSEEHAAAHGLPFNAQEVIDRVKQSAYFPGGDKPWFGTWKGSMRRQQARQARHARRAYRAQMRAQRRAFAHQAQMAPQQGDYAAQVLAGFFIPIASVINAALFVGLALAIFSLVTSGEVLGIRPPDSIPLWAQIAGLVIGYHMIAWPLHIVSHGPLYGRPGPARGWMSMWGGMLWLCFTALFLWLAYQNVPGVREFIDNFPDSLRNGMVTDRMTVLLNWVR